MAKKIITDEGKTEVLRIAFANDTTHTPFAYFALGDNGGTASETGIYEDLHELNHPSYHRVATQVEGDIVNKKITITGIFDENNYNSSDAITVGQLGLCNSDTIGEGKFFVYGDIPQLPKDNTISLKYSMIITIP